MKGKMAVIALTCVLLSACSDPKGTPLPADITKWSEDKGLMEAVKKLDDTEKRLFTGYATRRAMASVFGANKGPSEITLGEALKSQQAWLDEKAAEEIKQKELAQQVQQAQLAALKEMNGTLTASLIELTHHPVDYAQKKYSEYFTVQVAFKNNSAEALEGVKGTVVLSDIFGEVIKRINLSNDARIEPGQNYLYSGTMDFNQFQSTDKKLAATSFEKLKFDWEPDVYIFSSGRKQVMPR